MNIIHSQNLALPSDPCLESHPCWASSCSLPVSAVRTQNTKVAAHALFMSTVHWPPYLLFLQVSDFVFEADEPIFYICLIAIIDKRGLQGVLLFTQTPRGLDFWAIRHHHFILYLLHLVWALRWTADIQGKERRQLYHFEVHATSRNSVLFSILKQKLTGNYKSTIDRHFENSFLCHNAASQSGEITEHWSLT